MKKALSTLCVLVMLVSSLVLTPSAIGNKSEKWIGAWGTSPIDYFFSLEEYVGDLRVNGVIPAGTTIRTEVTVSASGEKLKMKFSNIYGDTPVNITQAAVARSVGKGAIKGDSIFITFNGSKSVEIPAGKDVWSDEIPMRVDAGEKLAVSTYYALGAYIKTAGLFGGTTYEDMGIHGFSKVDDKKFAIKNSLEIAANIYTYHIVPFLTNIDVLSASENARSIVFIGDSTLVNDTTGFICQRLFDAGYNDIGIVNEGIMGNRLCAKGSGLIGSLYGDDMLSRFERDALSVSGADTVFIKIGVNDILHPSSKTMNAPYVSEDEMINAYKQLINMAKDAGMKVYLITMTAWNGYEREILGGTKDIRWSPELQQMTDDVNDWIMNESASYGADGAIDVPELCDPNDRTKMAARFTLDGIHMSKLGSMVLCDTIATKETLGIDRDVRTIAEITGVNPYEAGFGDAPSKNTILNILTFIRQLLSSLVIQFEKIRQFFVTLSL